MSLVAIWDFDGTLAHRSSTWSGTLLEVLDEHQPGHTATIETIRPHLSARLPWHQHKRLHPELVDASAWWASVEAVLASALVACGADSARAARLARAAHERYVDASRFALFDDVLPALESLRADGWRHVILSNHVPEMRTIAEALGLGGMVEAIVNSAETGAEKPHAEAYRHARAAAGQHQAAWMLGDSYLADVQGAERAGIPGILVRSEDARAARRARDLSEAAELLRHAAAAR